MDDARQILLQALEQSGVPIPDAGVQSSFDLSPAALVSISSAALALIRRLPPPPPSLFPQSMADRFRLCSDLASSIKNLGYGPDISFHHFLYPSVEETHKILRFLLDNISRSNEGVDFRNVMSNKFAGDRLAASTPPEDGFKDASAEGEKSATSEIIIEKCHSKITGSSENPVAEWNHGSETYMKENNIMFLQQGTQSEVEHSKTSSIRLSMTEEELKEMELGRLEEILSNVSLENTKLTKDVMDLEQHLTQLEVECEASAKQLDHLKRDYSLLELAASIALDSSKDDAEKLEDLTNSISDSKLRLDTLNAKWENTLQELEEQTKSLEASPSNKKAQIPKKFDHLKDVREAIDHVTARSKLREQQLASLILKLEHATKGPSRSFYVERITELIRNSKKLDIDIARIIEEIRDLQRESNVNQGRLKRIYALVDEVIFRDAKKEPLYRQAYRHLTSLHENFSDCYDKVFTIDRVQREISELYATIESMEKNPVDVKKLQADIDIIATENLFMKA